MKNVLSTIRELPRSLQALLALAVILSGVSALNASPAMSLAGVSCYPNDAIDELYDRATASSTAYLAARQEISGLNGRLEVATAAAKSNRGILAAYDASVRAEEAALAAKLRADAAYHKASTTLAAARAKLAAIEGTAAASRQTCTGGRFDSRICRTGLQTQQAAVAAASSTLASTFRAAGAAQLAYVAKVEAREAKALDAADAIALRDELAALPAQIEEARRTATALEDLAAVAWNEYEAAADAPCADDEIGQSCQDGLDNDGDGSADCEDATCAGEYGCGVDTGADVAFVSTYAARDVGAVPGDADRVEFQITYAVTARGEDIYVDGDAGRYEDGTVEPADVASEVLWMPTADSTATSSGSAIVTALGGTRAEDVIESGNKRFLVRAGETRAFRFTLMAEASSDNTSLAARLVYVPWSTLDWDLPGNENHVPLGEEFQTELVTGLYIR